MNTFGTRPWLKHYTKGVDPDANYNTITIADMFANAVVNFPEHIFLTFKGRKTCYAQTNIFVRKLSIELLRLGVRYGDRVTLYLANCPQEPIGFLATVSLGAIAVPLDPSLPAAALAEKIVDSGATVIICLDLLYPEVKTARTIMGDKDPLNHVIIASISEFLPPVSSNLYSLGYPIKIKLNQWETAVRKLRCRDEQCVTDMGLEEDKLHKKLVMFERAQKDLKRDMHDHNESIHCFHEIINKKTTPQDWKNLDSYHPLPEDTAAIFYTSGTTGSTKGGMLSHCNLTHNPRQALALLPIPRGTEIFAGILPLSHSLPNTVSFMLCIERAGELVLEPDPRDIKSVRRAIRENKCSILVVVPKLLKTLCKKMTKDDLVDVKYILCGGAPLPDETRLEIETLTPGKLREGYGATELSPVVSFNPHPHQSETRSANCGSVGIPLPGTDVRIMDEVNGTWKEVSAGKLGRIHVRGKQVFLGYWNAPEKTAEVMTEDKLWFITSDIGWLDAEGYLYIKDRADDVIVLSNGEKVYPSDVEAVLKKHPAVEKVAVAGPITTTKEVGAFVVLRVGCSATEEDIKSFVRKNLPLHNVPRVIRFKSELPELAMGKVLRRVLLEEEGSLQD